MLWHIAKSDGSLKRGVLAVCACWDNSMARAVRVLDTTAGVGPITTVSATSEHLGETLEPSTIQLYFTMSMHFSWSMCLIATVRH